MSRPAIPHSLCPLLIAAYGLCFQPAGAQPPATTGIDAQQPTGAVNAVEGMVRIASAAQTVGTSPSEREALAKQFGCDPTWLKDDLEKHSVQLPAFWIDRTPVSNRQYGEYVAATGARAPWPDGWYSADAVDHPVVDVNQMEAAAYAAWVGKRLPTAEEWEVAIGSKPAGLFPWGEAWPGPVRTTGSEGTPDWRNPGTDRLGTGQHGLSAAGMEDFVQQVSEWTGTVRPHHGTTFVAVKGSSWLQIDPVNFRTASTSWAMASFATPWIGFRCALDGDRRPAAPATGVSVAHPQPSPAAPPTALSSANVIQVWSLREAPAPVAARVLDWTRRFLEAGRPAGSPLSRGFLLQSDTIGPWPIGLFLAEALYWKGTPLLAGLREADPELQAGKDTSGHPAYSLHFPELDVTFAFVPGQDCIDLVTSITNRSDTPGAFLTSSCFSLINHPRFYDCEMRRTYTWTQDRGFVAQRQIPRVGDFIRWITDSDIAAYGGPGIPGTMAVVSRDGRWTFASVRLEGAAAYRLSGNTWLDCLHTDAAVTVAAQATRTTRQRIYLLPGGLQALEARLRSNQADSRH